MLHRCSILLQGLPCHLQPFPVSEWLILARPVAYVQASTQLLFVQGQQPFGIKTPAPGTIPAPPLHILSVWPPALPAGQPLQSQKCILRQGTGTYQHTLAPAGHTPFTSSDLRHMHTQHNHDQPTRSALAVPSPPPAQQHQCATLGVRAKRRPGAATCTARRPRFDEPCLSSV